MCHLSVMNRKGIADVLTDPSNRPDSLMQSTWAVHAF